MSDYQVSPPFETLSDGPIQYKIGDHRKISTISDDFVLISDSQDRYDVLESIGALNLQDSTGHLWVLVGDGEYLEVWQGTKLIPYYTDNVYRIA